MEVQERELHRIVPTAVIYKKENGKIQYLITKRSLEKKAFPGKWTVPGGGLVIDDYINTPKTDKDNWYFALEKSLRREIKEEVNLAVGKLQYLLDITFIRSDGIPVLILSFFGPYESGGIKLDEESIDFAWVSLKEAKNYDLVEGLLGEIEMVDNIVNR